MNYFIIPGLQQRFVKIEDRIIDVIAGHYGFNSEMVKKKSNSIGIVKAQRFCYYFLRQKTNLTLNDIGRIFSSKHHSKVGHGLIALKNLQDVYPELTEELKILSNKL